MPLSLFCILFLCCLVVASATVLPLQANSVPHSVLLWAQVRHWLALKEEACSQHRGLRDEDGLERLAQWTQPVKKKRRQLDANKNDTTSSDDKSNSDTTLALSNCHLLYYTAQVGIGTPTPQMFSLVIDSSSTDLWVPSSDCTEFDGCYALWRRYNSSLSDSFAPLNDNYMENLYINGGLEGQKVKDVIHLTPNLKVPHQGFALIDKKNNHGSNDGICTGWDGYLGLGPTSEGYTVEGFEEDLPTMLGNIKRQKLLQHQIFSLYLDATDDYPPYTPDEALSEPLGVIPTQASSEIVFGGVKRSHYKGCLNWHNLHAYFTFTGEKEIILWNFDMQGASVGDVSLPNSNLAIVDSRSAVSVGTPEAIGAYASYNKLTCMVEDHDTGKVTTVKCDGPFDLAYTECARDDIVPLEFLIDDVTYTVNKTALLIPIEASEVGREEPDGNPDGNHTWCLLSLIPVVGVPGWLLGDRFIREYYAVFDFENYAIGLAPRRLRDESDESAGCPADAYLDVSHASAADNGTPPSPSMAPAAKLPDNTDTTAIPSMAPAAKSPLDDNSTTAVPSMAPATMSSGGNTTTSPTHTPVYIPTSAVPTMEATPTPTVGTPVATPIQTPPHHKISPPHSQPHHIANPPVDRKKQPDTDDEDSPSGALPIIILGAVAFLGVFFFWRRRRQRVRYARAAYFDDSAGYRIGGDMELAEFS